MPSPIDFDESAGVCRAASIWVWSLHAERAGPLLQRESILSSDEIERANRFYFEDDRRRFIACRVGLRFLLGNVLSHDPAAIEFSYGQHGKPSLVGSLAASPLRFNVSNSGELAVAALTTGGEIGIDVEFCRDCDTAEPIARRHFTESEANHIARSNGNEKQSRFFQLWTAKEAVVKLLGSGLSFSLDRFETPDAAGNNGNVALPKEAEIGECWLTPIELATGYAACVATSRQPAQVCVQQLAMQ